MPKQKPLADRILTAAGSAKSKTDIAAKLGVSYAYVSREVNALVQKGKLTVVKLKAGPVGRPAVLYKRA